MSNTPVQDMYEDAMTPQVRHKFSAIKDYMKTQGNVICTNCGGEMVSTTGCYICPSCGKKDCGGE